MSSMEVNVDLLEQMDLMDVSDQEALDVFLNSGEDSSVLSPGLGPESSACQDEIMLQVPDPSELPAKPPSSPSACSSSGARDPRAGGESPLVQSDEEEVQVDTALTTLHADSKDTPDVSDGSDS